MPSTIDTTHQEIAAAYDLWAPQYDNTHNPMLWLTNRLLQASPLPWSNQDVLELGCGSGRLGHMALRGGAHSFTGVDASHGMLQKTPSADPSWCVMRGDITGKLQLPRERYGVVLIVLVLEHIENVLPVMKNAARYLAPGGQLRVLEVHPDMLARGGRAHFAQDGRTVCLPCYAHTTEELAEACTTSGMRVTSSAPVHATKDLVQACPKLQKHAGHPVLVDLTATLVQQEEK